MVNFNLGGQMKKKIRGDKRAFFKSNLGITINFSRARSHCSVHAKWSWRLHCYLRVRYKVLCGGVWSPWPVHLTARREPSIRWWVHVELPYKCRLWCALHAGVGGLIESITVSAVSNQSLIVARHVTAANCRSMSSVCVCVSVSSYFVLLKATRSSI